MTDFTSTTLDMDFLNFSLLERPDSTEHAKLFGYPDAALFNWVQRVLDPSSKALLRMHPPPPGHEKDIQAINGPPIVPSNTTSKATTPNPNTPDQIKTPDQTNNNTTLSSTVRHVPYHTETSWVVDDTDLHCYVCLEPITDQQQLVRLDCACHKPHHAHCFSDILDSVVKLKSRDADPLSELPSFVMNCNYCHTPLFGAHHAHFTRANEIWYQHLEEAKDNIMYGAQYVPVVIGHLTRLLKSIWIHWRCKNMARNRILADIYGALGNAYSRASRFITAEKFRQYCDTLTVVFYMLMWQAQGLKPQFSLGPVHFMVGKIIDAYAQQKYTFVSQALPIVVHTLLRMLKRGAPSLELHIEAEQLLIEVMDLGQKRSDAVAAHVSCATTNQVQYVQLSNFIVHWRMEHMMHSTEAFKIEKDGVWERTNTTINKDWNGKGKDRNTVDGGNARNGIEWKDVSSIELGPRHDANVFISAELDGLLRNLNWACDSVLEKYKVFTNI